MIIMYLELSILSVDIYMGERGRNSFLTRIRVQNRSAKQANFYKEFSVAP